MNRTERLFALSEYLRSRRTGVTAGELADRFGVNIRTVHRDLTTLRNASMPIASERGRGGGFALDAHYSLPPVNISAREAAVLLTLASYAKEMRLVPFQRTLDGAVTKIRAALSSSGQRELARRLSELAFVGVPAHPVAREVEHAVEQAWFEQSFLDITYQGHQGHTEALRIRIRSIVFDRHEVRLNVSDPAGHERQLRMHRVHVDDDPRRRAAVGARAAVSSSRLTAEERTIRRKRAQVALAATLLPFVDRRTLP